MFLDRLLRFFKENNPFYRNIVIKTENIPSHLSWSNIFDNSCEQNINDGFAVNNVVECNVPLFIDDKEETIEEASYLDEYPSRHATSRDVS